MNFSSVVVLVLVLASLCTEGHKYDSEDNIPSWVAKERHYRSLKDNAETSNTKSKNATILERWENFENKLKGGVNYVIKQMMPYVMDGTGSMKISPQCTREAMLLIAGIKKLKPWAVRFLDSSAKIFDGLFEGTLSALGVYDECLDIEALSEKSKDKGKIIFKGKYCTMEIRLPVPPKTRFSKFGRVLPELQNFSTRGTVVSEAAQYAEFMHVVSFRMGLCVPSGCSVADINQLAETLGEMVGLDTTVSQCDIKEKKIFTPVQIFVIFAYSLATFLLVVATSVGIYCHFYPIKFTNKAMRLLMCFNFLRNFQKFTNTESGSDSLQCLHGFRFISMSWVILAHSYLNINHHALLGVKRAEAFSRDFFFQAIINSTITVDSFYVVGGLLLSYLGIKMVKVEKKRLSITFYILHRLLRIMPAYIFTMMIMFLSYHFGSGPLWDNSTKRYIDGCYKNWWTNLIFINNFYDPENMCLPQSWYITSDFQLYVASLGVLVALLRKPRLGIAICVVATVACIAYSGIGTYVLGIPYALTFASPDTDLIFEYLSRFYFKPFAHVGAYCVGIMSGYLLATYPKLKIPWKIQVLGWSLAFVSNFSVVYGLFEWNKGYEPTVFEGLMFASLARTAWAMGVAWVLVVCSTGHGGIVNYILSWKVFIPLGRLTFTVFLIHPIVQLIFFGNIRTLLQPDNMIVVYLFFGHACISYMLSFALSMLIEVPAIQMEKVITNGDMKESRKNDADNFKKNVALSETIRTSNSDAVKIIRENGNAQNGGIDNEAAVYKL